MVGGWVRVQGGVDKEFGVKILCKLYAVICFPLLFWLYPPLRSGHTLCIALRLFLRVSLFLNTEIIHYCAASSVWLSKEPFPSTQATPSAIGITRNNRTDAVFEIIFIV